MTNWFNHQGLLVTASNVFGRIFKNTYDLEDRVTNTVDAAGVSLASTYDELGRLLTRTYPDTGVERFGYSARGLVAYTNQLERTNYYVYDEARRKTYETNANREVTQFRYDVSGNLTNLIDGKNQNTFWKYDEYSRVTNKLDHLNNLVFAYKYDRNNRLTNRWTPVKGTTAYSYDRVGNLTNVDYATSADILLQYDALNRPTNMVDAVGTTKYGYNTVGQLLSEDGPWSDDAVSYTYQNQLRQSASVAAPNASAWAVSYAYDVMKRLTNITSPVGSFGYGYVPNPSQLVRKLTLPSSAYITNDYDNVSRQLFTKLVKSDNSILNFHHYDYNPGNQRTNQARVNLVSTNGPAYLATNSVAYGYDAIGQLLAAEGKEADNTVRLSEKFAYTYDTAGNLSNRVQHLLTNTFNVNSLNELTTVTRAGNLTVAGTTSGRATNVTVNTLEALLYNDASFARTNMSLSDGDNTFTAIAKDSYGRLDTNSVTTYLPATATYTYDLNGNLLSDGRRWLDYDDENQLTRVLVNQQYKSEFSYDGKMRRRVRKEFGWTSDGGLQTEFVSSATPGSSRNNFSGWVGFRFQVGNAALTLNELGRWIVSGNSGTHTVKIVQANGSDLSGASVSIDTDGATAGQFKYEALASPVTLAANTAYYVVSQETSGADSWYDLNTLVTPTPAGSIIGPAWSGGGTSYTYYSGSPNQSYVPVNFKYAGSWVQTNEVRYVYDGNLVVQERDANNLPTVTYTRGKDLSGSIEGAGGIGGLLARTDMPSTINSQPSTAFYHSDGNGNVTCLINTNQIIVAKYLYDPFGNTLSASGPLAEANLYRFSSKELHPNSGLVYYLYRHYASDLQRWLNRDPLNEIGGINLYSFLRNKPYQVDSWGLSERDEFCTMLCLEIAFWAEMLKHALLSSDAPEMLKRAVQAHMSEGCPPCRPPPDKEEPKPTPNPPIPELVMCRVPIPVYSFGLNAPPTHWSPTTPSVDPATKLIAAALIIGGIYLGSRVLFPRPSI